MLVRTNLAKSSQCNNAFRVRSCAVCSVLFCMWSSRPSAATAAIRSESIDWLDLLHARPIGSHSSSSSFSKVPNPTPLFLHGPPPRPERLGTAGLLLGSFKLLWNIRLATSTMQSNFLAISAESCEDGVMGAKSQKSDSKEGWFLNFVKTLTSRRSTQPQKNY